MKFLTDKVIDTADLLSQVSVPEAGAVVLFVGTTRQQTDGRTTLSLDYEGYAEMAEKKLADLVEEAKQRWPIARCRVVHRLGHLEVGEASVSVAVSSAHRDAAFEAGRWLIDTIKEVVPIWKCENWADGSSKWIHPGIPEQHHSE
ncbi:MAG: molybdenum cofactor biosynthesis protein MoaE [Planctomycetales bacterium]